MPHYVYTTVLEPTDIHEIDLSTIPGAELNQPKFGTLKFTTGQVFVEAPNKKTARNVANGLIEDAIK